MEACCRGLLCILFEPSGRFKIKLTRIWTISLSENLVLSSMSHTGGCLEYTQLMLAMAFVAHTNGDNNTIRKREKPIVYETLFVALPRLWTRREVCWTNKCLCNVFRGLVLRACLQQWLLQTTLQPKKKSIQLLIGWILTVWKMIVGQHSNRCSLAANLADKTAAANEPRRRKQSPKPCKYCCLIALHNCYVDLVINIQACPTWQHSRTLHRFTQKTNNRIIPSIFFKRKTLASVIRRLPHFKLIAKTTFWII